MQHMTRLAFCLVSLGLGLQGGCSPATTTGETAVPGVSRDGPEREAGPGDPQSASASRHEQEEAKNLLWDGREPDPEGSLPRISTRHIGMHIGGGDNSDQGKRPWLEAIEQGETRLLKCYRFVERPLHGGTFGVDFYVGAGETSAEVRDMRHQLGGDRFASCMKNAFERLSFPPPERPMVVSYSLRFDVKA